MTAGAGDVDVAFVGLLATAGAGKVNVVLCRCLQRLALARLMLSIPRPLVR